MKWLRPWSALSVHAKLGRLYLCWFLVLGLGVMVFGPDIRATVIVIFLIFHVALAVIVFTRVTCPRCQHPAARGSAWFPPRRCPKCGLDTRKAA